MTRKKLSLAAITLFCLVCTLASSFLYITPAHAGDKVQEVQGKTYKISADTTYAPFEFRDSGGQFVGIDVDLLKAIAQDQGFNVNIDSIGFDAAVQSVKSNQADAVMAGMTITDERKKVFDFSDPYYDSGIQIAVKKQADSSQIPQTLEDIKGKKVVVKTGTEGAKYAQSLASQYNLSISTYDSSANMASAVQVGQADALFEDYPVIAYGVKQGNGLELTKIPKKEAGKYGFAVNKGKNQDLLKAFNQGLKNLKENGKYKEITNKYLSTDQSSTEGPFKLLKDSLPALGQGLMWTLLVTVCALAGSLILGIVFGFLKVSRHKIFRGIATTYVSIFRGTPVIVQAFFFYMGIPAVTGITLSPFVAGTMTLALNAGAYMTEIIRGGIQAVPPGQMEAGRSLGLGYVKTMQKIVLPQAFKTMMPSTINQAIITLKDTSLLTVLGLQELTWQGQQIIARTYESFQVWIIVGAIYFVVILLLTRLSNMLDKKVNK